MRWASAADTDRNLAAAVEHACEAVFLGLGRAEPDLLIAFVSPAYAAGFNMLADLVRREFDKTLLFGCCAQSVIGGGREIEDRPAVSLTGALLPGVKLQGTHLETSQLPPIYAEASMWEDTLRVTAGQQPSFLLLADPYGFETETVLRGLDRVYPRAPKIGGLASGGAPRAGGSALFLGSRLYHSGCIMLTFTGDIEIDTIVAQGCRPIGDPMFVTVAHENLIRELDGRSARDTLASVFEHLRPADQELFEGSLFLGLAMQSGTSEYLPGDFLIRSILGMDPQSGALWINANIVTNSVVQFHLRDAATSAYDLERTLTEYRASRSADTNAGVLLFSCAGRGTTLYGQSDHDSNAFRRLVADLPIGGFFCAGEIGPVQHSTYLHGFTSAFAVIRTRQ
ncbi:hypothetical protein ACG33_01520 [Steroidobacter denitrificans]|uniref:Histidine kinase n=1 Tax=Steroidobacter denitrificans TaxID=465721 RepID=A0A127F872_STEDE|nr:FIST N-terminal domain-containing protein [Steroidobacter denitrificans]AMN45805.1 hypothetical protein ACG33_01520 [Steroidobacter denitrificans]